MDLKARQEASEKVEREMLDFLMQFSPAGELRLADARTIAFKARASAFNHFDPEKA